MSLQSWLQSEKFQKISLELTKKSFAYTLGYRVAKKSCFLYDFILQDLGCKTCKRKIHKKTKLFFAGQKWSIFKK